jgi:hypothetical protein
VVDRLLAMRIDAVGRRLAGPPNVGDSLVSPGDCAEILVAPGVVGTVIDPLRSSSLALVALHKVTPGYVTRSART